MKALINPRYTFELDDYVERASGSNTYDFMLTDDLNRPLDEFIQVPGESGWIMLDVSNN